MTIDDQRFPARLMTGMILALTPGAAGDPAQ